MLRQNSITTTNPRTMQKTNGLIEVVGTELLRRIRHIVRHCIHHHSHIKIISRKMTLGAIQDICLNAATTHMPQKKTTISAMKLAELSCQAMPLQCLPGIDKLPILMNVVQARKCPILERLLQLLKLPEIQLKQCACVRVHGAAAWLA